MDRGGALEEFANILVDMFQMGTPDLVKKCRALPSGSISEECVTRIEQVFTERQSEHQKKYGGMSPWAVSMVQKYPDRKMAEGILQGLGQFKVLEECRSWWAKNPE